MPSEVPRKAGTRLGLEPGAVSGAPTASHHHLTSYVSSSFSVFTLIPSVYSLCLLYICALFLPCPTLNSLTHTPPLSTLTLTLCDHTFTSLSTVISPSPPTLPYPFSPMSLPAPAPSTLISALCTLPAGSGPHSHLFCSLCFTPSYYVFFVILMSSITLLPSPSMPPPPIHTDTSFLHPRAYTNPPSPSHPLHPIPS